MSATSPLLGRKWSAGRLKRHREVVARMKAEGHYKAVAVKQRDPRTEIVTLTCANPPCGKTFKFAYAPRFSRKKLRYHSHLCQVRHQHELRRKCPADYETLYDLYVTKRMTTVAIAEMFGVTSSAVRIALILVGIPRRKGGFQPKAMRAAA